MVGLALENFGSVASKLATLIDGLAKKHISSRAINIPMNIITPTAHAFLPLQAAVSEKEHNIIGKRVKEGIVAARARGLMDGRPRIISLKKYSDLLTDNPSY